MTREERRKWMGAVIAEWRASGMGVDEMAAKAGVSVGTLWRWRKLVGRAPGEPGVPLTPIRFLPVQIVGGNRQGGAATGEMAPAVEVVLRSGTRLSIPEGFSPEALERLLCVVVRTC